MQTQTLIQDLYDYNEWANAKILKLAEGLSDAQLDAEQPMGFGSLRATLFHMAFAERLWLDRWQSKPWAPISHNWSGIPLEQIAREFRQVAGERNVLIASESSSDFGRIVDYANSNREPFRHRLRELLVHVVNHGIYHRAQALNFLRHCGRTVPAGLDYLFYKIAKPTLPNEGSSVEALRNYGLEANDQIWPAPKFDPLMVRRYCAYGNWAMDTAIQLSREVPNSDLDRPFEMGMGSLRKNLRHITEVEQWWYRNWTAGPGDSEKLPEDMSIAQLDDEWLATTARRDDWLAKQSAEELATPVTAAPGGTPLQFRRGETIVQLCGHGTHHRAQTINMLRQIGAKPPAIDYVVWLRGPGAIDDSPESS